MCGPREAEKDEETETLSHGLSGILKVNNDIID